MILIEWRSGTNWRIIILELARGIVIGLVNIYWLQAIFRQESWNENDSYKLLGSLSHMQQ